MLEMILQERTVVMKHSIRRQFATIFILLMAGTILLCWCANQLFLESFYVNRKAAVIKEAYVTIGKSANSEAYTPNEFGSALEEVCRVNNMTAFVMDANSQIKFVSTNGGRELEGRLMGHLFGLTPEQVGDEILERGEDYVLRKTTLREGEFLEMYGRLNSGISFIMMSPLESIRESAQIATTFLAYAGIIAAVVGAVIIWYVTKRTTKPIEELNEISKQMVNLNFDAKYQGASNNEIGLLGKNINEMSESLERAISELKTANNELQKDIQKKEEIDEIRKEFLSNVSHELKTPIALIQGYAEGLQEGISSDPDSMRFYCEVIMDEANKMNTMVQKLLTLNQLESGNDVVSMSRVDIYQCVSDCAKAVEILMKQKDITLLIEGTGPIYAWADEFRMEEVITNYLSNAINHCAGEKKIIVSFTEIEEKVRISVFNTGEPIPEEALAHLWEKFYKVDKARTREYGGSGIGLSIVKAIMDSMHQAVGVENYNNGVLFWFELEKCEKN